MNILTDYEFLTVTLFGLYGIALFFLFCYGLMQIHLVYQYLKIKRRQRLIPPEEIVTRKEYPRVTVQLPVYNEKYVMERLIDAVAGFRYPKECLQIQVLDDSTDETVEIVAKKVSYWQGKGINILHIRRSSRQGYKAGALQEAMGQATGAFIAIFDADFVPGPDFLEKTVPAFDDPGIGMVQTRWDHLNKRYSVLTHVQSFLLDAHFSIEQVARNACGYFINFSGTGGVWRRTCIETAGGWHSDTLTEDFDLSYRAQLKGWKFRYLEHVGAPAELPPVMSALKNQQYRWIKGITETSKKHLPDILRANISAGVKIHAIFHLLVGVVFISALVCSVLSVPLLFLKQQVPHLHNLFSYASFSLVTLVFLAVFHFVATIHTQSARETDARLYFLKNFPLYLCFSMGISLHNAVAVLEGWLGVKTSFVRTPKFNVDDVKNKFTSNVYRVARLSPLNFAEAGMVLYFLGGAVSGIVLGDYTMLPYHLMLAFGFGMICYFSIAEMQSDFFKKLWLKMSSNRASLSGPVVRHGKGSGKHYPTLR